jgi:hypothetical protein
MNLRRMSTIVVAVVGLAVASETARQPLTNDDIIKLVRSGFGEPLLLQAIESQLGNFNLSATAVAELRRVGVGESLIAAMMRTQKSAAPHVPLLEPGVYYKGSDAYALVRVETVDWTAVHSNAEGFTRVRLTGQVGNKTSWLSLQPRGELLIVCQPGHTAFDYHLLRAEVRAAWREFHADGIVRGEKLIALANNDATAARVEFDETFDLGVRVLLNTLRPGEYGLVPPDLLVDGRVRDSGTIYTFAIE